MTKEERKEYYKAYYREHREENKARARTYYEAHREEKKARARTYYEAHRDEKKARMKAYDHEHREERYAYQKDDVNSSGQSKHSIRVKSNQFLTKNGTKIPGYEIHHCFTYDEPYKFIYCSKEMHLLIHQYLREHNIDADSEHYEQIKHLLDDTVILYGITK